MEAKIVSINEGLKIDERGNIVRTRVVLFYIGNDGPFTIEIPANEFSPEIVQQKIEEERRKIMAIRGIK